MRPRRPRCEEKMSACIAIAASGWTARATQAWKLHAVATYAAIYPKGYGMGGIEIYHSNSPGSGKEVVIH